VSCRETFDFPNCYSSTNTISQVQFRCEETTGVADGHVNQCLVEDTLRTTESSLSKSRGDTTPEQRAKVFDAKVKGGNLRAAAHYITGRECGGVLEPDEID